jgi:hypothetical protein
MKEMCGDGWENSPEGRERMDFIKTACLQWMNLNISDTGRLDEFFDHTANSSMPSPRSAGHQSKAFRLGRAFATERFFDHTRFHGRIELMAQCHFLKNQLPNARAARARL